MRQRNKTHFKKLFFEVIGSGNFKALSLLAITAILCINTTVFAINDDPGAGRLSGTDIPAAFYESSVPENDSSSYNLQNYGAEKTKSKYTKKTYIHGPNLVERPITHGIDVSFYQGEIDWKKVKADGIDFAFIRVGYRGSAEGTLNEDIYYKQNIEGALAAGVEVGVYIFSQAITKKEAIAEANYLLKRIKDYDITFPVVLDYEFYGEGRLVKADLSKKKATNICLAFCETVEAAGYTPMVYANPDMLDGHLNAEAISDKYSIWLANYTTQTGYTGVYDYWQYSSEGSVKGIKGNVDMNFFYGTDIANANIDPMEDFIYTGSNLKPLPTITYKDETLVKGTDYTLSYTNNKAIGVATITVTGKNTFYGTNSTTFNIRPRQMSTVKTKKKSTDFITLSWTKDSSIDGYQIYRASAMDGKYKKIATIENKSTTTYTDKNVTKGQCYYYKIQNYKTVNGKNWFGAISDIKSIYTKIDYTRNAFTKNATALYSNTAIDETPILELAKQDTMSIIYATEDKNGDEWYYVKCIKDDATYKGYIKGSSITITRLGKVTGKKVNVRTSASINSKKLTTLNKNKEVTILKAKKKKGMTWYQIQFQKKDKTYKGWISADYIKII